MKAQRQFLVSNRHARQARRAVYKARRSFISHENSDIESAKKVRTPFSALFLCFLRRQVTDAISSMTRGAKRHNGRVESEGCP